MLPVKTATELLHLAESEHLYKNLIQQLNKDFLLANLSMEFSLELPPLELKEELQAVMKKLIVQSYDEYLNLLYRIDVPERDLLGIKSTDMAETSGHLAFVILKREFQKVWFKNKL